MRRSTMFLVAFGAAFVAALAAVLLLYGDRIAGGSPPPTAINAEQENATEPYRAEMTCIDRLMQRHDLLANQVQAELERCRGAPAEPPADGNGQ
jgi:Flp pilus assembly protein TadB